VQVGTPPKTILATLDTGSDVFWLQCEPCEECYQQIGPIFDPTQSSSYTALKCSSPECASLDTYQCGKVSGLCLYEVAYGDGSVTVGDFSQETITLTSTSSGNPFQIPQFAFGCGHMNNGNFGGSAGVLGLGRGKLSFPSQLQALGQQAAVSFMYCLTDRFSNPSANSHIVFGESASITPALGIQYTPLLQNPHLPAYYYVGLMGISVGLAVIQFPVSFYLVDAATGNGGVILDSGTSISQLTELAYISFRGAFQAATTHLQTAPGTALLDTCYTIVSGNPSTVAIPRVSFLFENKVWASPWQTIIPFPFPCEIVSCSIRVFLMLPRDVVYDAQLDINFLLVLRDKIFSAVLKSIYLQAEIMHFFSQLQGPF